MKTNDILTVLVATHDRPHNLVGQLSLFAKAGLTVVVADSSNSDKADEVRSASEHVAEFFAYPPETKFFDKLADAVARIKTPFVLLASDRKITFPHAIDSTLDFLEKHDDYISAQGYVIGFSTHDDDIDINRVVFFTPSIEEVDPLHRHYHLMRRYQSRQFSLFRLKPLICAIAQARTIDGVMFQEIMFMNALVLQGKTARVPSIMNLQTVEQSFSRLRDIDPFYWFLHDSRSFFRHYARYRNSLARFISDNGLTQLAMRELRHALDAVHAVWLNYNFDAGVLNLATQQILEGKHLDLPHPRPPIPWRQVGWKDVVHSRRRRGRYIWRKNVLNAEPKNEIYFSRDEMKCVEGQLDTFFDL
jgi:glycosyltransferase domain-containing protein